MISGIVLLLSRCSCIYNSFHINSIYEILQDSVMRNRLKKWYREKRDTISIVLLIVLVALFFTIFITYILQMYGIQVYLTYLALGLSTISAGLAGYSSYLAKRSLDLASFTTRPFVNIKAIGEDDDELHTLIYTIDNRGVLPADSIKIITKFDNKSTQENLECETKVNLLFPNHTVQHNVYFGHIPEMKDLWDQSERLNVSSRYPRAEPVALLQFKLRLT